MAPSWEPYPAQAASSRRFKSWCFQSATPPFPSDAEKQRPLADHEIRRYQRHIRIGFYGLLSVLALVVCLAAGSVTVKGNYQMWTVAYVILGFVFYSVTLVTGLSKGRDHRPSIMQMLAGGGRR